MQATVVRKSKCVQGTIQRETIIYPPTHHQSITSGITQSSQVMTLVWDRFLASQHSWQVPTMQVAKRGTFNALLFKTVQKVMHEALLSVLEEEEGKKKVGRSGL